MTTEKIRNIAYWTATIFGPTSFVIGGVLNISRTEQPEIRVCASPADSRRGRCLEITCAARTLS